MNDITEILQSQDSSAYMDGSHNWVIPAHPEDPTKRGQVKVSVPWQAWFVLSEAANYIRELERARWENTKTTLRSKKCGLRN